MTSDKPAHRILYVDDEKDNLTVFNSAFRREYEVYLASSGQEGLEILKKHEINVIITDQRMPEMTGSEFFKIVHEKHPHIVRIIMSGYSDMNALISSVNDGEIFRYVSKPWEREELLDTIRLAAAKYKENITHRKLIDENKHLIERNREVAIRLSQTMEELKRVQMELEELNKKS